MALNLALVMRELFCAQIGALFGADVLLSALATIAFIRRDGTGFRVRQVGLPTAAICLVGVSCVQPLFLFVRERQGAAR